MFVDERLHGRDHLVPELLRAAELPRPDGVAHVSRHLGREVAIHGHPGQPRPRVHESPPLQPRLHVHHHLADVSSEYLKVYRTYNSTVNCLSHHLENNKVTGMIGTCASRAVAANPRLSFHMTW